MAIGERTPLAVIDAAASARMAVGEVITNMAGASIEKIGDIKLSANWMAAAGEGQEDQKLFDAVHAVGMEFCPALGMSIPVGKDSMSMKTKWREGCRGQGGCVAAVADCVGVCACERCAQNADATARDGRCGADPD